MTMLEDFVKAFIIQEEIEKNAKKLKEEIFAIALKDAELYHEEIKGKPKEWLDEMHEKLKGKGYSFGEYHPPESVKDFEFWYLCKKDGDLLTGRSLKVVILEDGISVEVGSLSLPTENETPIH